MAVRKPESTDSLKRDMRSRWGVVNGEERSADVVTSTNAKRTKRTDTAPERAFPF